MEYRYNNGSIWRKWDFHVHTKGTNKNDQFTCKDFSEYCEVLFTKALEKEISAIGITDYFSIENYKKVIEYQCDIDRIDLFDAEEKLRIKNIFIFPNIELRLLPVTDSGRLINFHCIFNPGYVTQLDNDFFASLSHIAHEQEYKMNPQGIIALGRSIDPLLSNDAAYKKGIENFVVAHTGIKELLNKNINLKNNVITVVSNSNNDGASALQKHYDLFEEGAGALDGVRSTIYKLSQCIFSGNPSDREYFLGKKRDAQTEVIRKCGSLKACIHGSDAHTEDKLFSPDNNRYCWIKSDLSFEGLKQVLCEPEERIRIQSDSPEDKKPYNVIQKVCFRDNKTTKTFTDFEIGFNPNLNAIIGGKSSGKSLLLHLMAKKIGNKTDLKNYSSAIKDVDLDIFYADSPENPIADSDKRIIEFLPQLYIESIVREKSLVNTSQGGESNQFNKFIEDLIRQEEEIDNLFKIHSGTIQECSNIITHNVSEWIKLDNTLKRLHTELKPLGDKDAISNEIRRQDSRIEELAKGAGLSPEELDVYNRLTQENEALSREINSININESELVRLRDYVNSQVVSTAVSNITFTSLSKSSIDLFNCLKTDIADSLRALIATYKEKFKEIYTEFEKEKKEKEEKKKTNEAELMPLLAKNKIQEEISAIEQAIAIEKGKIKAIEDKIAEITAVKAQRDALAFTSTYKDMCESYKSLQEKINKTIATKWDETETQLKLTSEAIFNSLTFTESLKTVINVRSYLENQLPGSGFNGSEYTYDDKNHISNIDNILKQFTTDDNRFSSFKGSGNTESALRALFKDCFYIDYDITKSGDSLKTMSEGKKGIVILQLYLSLSKADCPILIDQPEDNLDNRTVFKELNNYIKRSKQRRQIIMVSHNANLVVNTDAENIIVANQSGQDGKENLQYRFEYVNGPLENTSAYDGAIKGILHQQGIREHVCEILEGGVDAFERREQKYDIKRLSL